MRSIALPLRAESWAPCNLSAGTCGIAWRRGKARPQAGGCPLRLTVSGFGLRAGLGRGNGTVRGVSDSADDIEGDPACASGVGVRLVQVAGVAPGFVSAGFLP